jgi:hypothetical protein
MEMTLRYAHWAPELIDDALQTLDGESPAWSQKAAGRTGLDDGCLSRGTSPL